VVHEHLGFISTAPQISHLLYDIGATPLAPCSKPQSLTTCLVRVQLLQDLTNTFHRSRRTLKNIAKQFATKSQQRVGTCKTRQQVLFLALFFFYLCHVKNTQMVLSWDVVDLTVKCKIVENVASRQWAMSIKVAGIRLLAFE
jgi:hypothetical protein